MTVAGAWFVDGRLIYKAAKTDGYFVQFKRLRKLIEGEYGIPLRAAFYFDSAPSTDADTRRHKYLAGEVGLRVVTYPLGRKISTCPECREKIETRPQKCVDIALAMYILEFASKKDPIAYDTLVFSSGDRDFLPVLEKVRDEYDKDVVLVAPRAATAGELVPVSTRQIWIEDHYSSVADRWQPKIHAMSEATRGSNAEEQGVLAARSVEQAKEVMRRTWEGLEKYEKPLPSGKRGRPWGYLLNNFGRLCGQEELVEKLDPYLVETEGRYKGANGICLALAKEMWPGCSIENNADGFPFLVDTG